MKNCYEGKCIYCGEPTTKGICEKCNSRKGCYDYSLVHDDSEKTTKPCNYKNMRKCPDFISTDPQVAVADGNIYRMNGTIKATRFNLWREKRFVRLNANCRFSIANRCSKGEK